MAKSSGKVAKKEDLSWNEVFQLSKTYLKIPLALLFVELLYWFITQPSNTLVPIQITEAWLWNGITNLIYGDGTSTLTTHNGWMTQVNLYNENFPGVLDTVALYVSDECAGIHEMLFISTLIIMTDGVSQKIKLRSILVMCGIVYVLNIVRLVAFYPIAADACALDPNSANCLNPMWNFHETVYSWGFLIVLILMWLMWFWKIGGPSRALEAADKDETFRFKIRKSWSLTQYLILAFVAIMLFSSAYSITSNEEAMNAKDTLDFCSFSSIATNECITAQNTWDNAISTAWSLAAIGLIVAAFTIVQFETRKEKTSLPDQLLESE